MDSFDDAFGTSPPDTDIASTLKTNGNGFFLEDEADPAADFLAREQDNFAGLEDDIPVVGESTVQNGDFTNDNVIKEDFDAGNYVDINNDFLSEERSSSPILSSPQTFSMPREEPEKIRIWREDQKRRLEIKDAEEEESKEKLRAAAKKELDEWYKNYDEGISKTKNSNRKAEEDGASGADTPSDDGKDWEKIANLCDFNPKSSKQQKDISRMRSLILQLKQNPPARRQSSASSSNAS